MRAQAAPFQSVEARRCLTGVCGGSIHHVWTEVCSWSYRYFMCPPLRVNLPKRNSWARLAPMRSAENTAPVVIEPINGSARNVLGHSLHSVIEGPAVSAIKIALVLDKQVRRNRMEVTRQYARPDVRVQLPSHGAVNRSRSPFAVSFRRILRSGVIEFLRILREYRHGKSETLRLRSARLLSVGILKQILNAYIDAKLSCSSGHYLGSSPIGALFALKNQLEHNLSRSEPLL